MQRGHQVSESYEDRLDSYIIKESNTIDNLYVNIEQIQGLTELLQCQNSASSNDKNKHQSHGNSDQPLLRASQFTFLNDPKFITVNLHQSQKKSYNQNTLAISKFMTMNSFPFLKYLSVCQANLNNIEWIGLLNAPLLEMINLRMNKVNNMKVLAKTAYSYLKILLLTKNEVLEQRYTRMLTNKKFRVEGLSVLSHYFVFAMEITHFYEYWISQRPSLQKPSRMMLKMKDKFVNAGQYFDIDDFDQ